MTENENILDKIYGVVFQKSEATLGVSFAVAAAAIFNWRLGIAMASSVRTAVFAADFVLSMIMYAGFLVFWTPVMHLLAEKTSAGARLLLRETNIAAAALALYLPVGLITRAVSATAAASIADVLLRLFFIWRLSSAAMKIYSIGRLKSLALVAAPGTVFLFWSLAAASTTVIKLWQMFR
jgi:hypothetical protein